MKQSYKRSLSILVVLSLVFTNFLGIINWEKAAGEAVGTDAIYTIAAWLSDDGIMNDQPSAPATSGINRSEAEMTVSGGVKYDASQSGHVDWRDGIGTKYWLATLSTKNFEHITLSSKQRSGNSGPRDFAIEISPDMQQWTEVQEVILPPTSKCENADCRLVDVALPAWFSDQDEVYIRWVIRSTDAANSERELGEWGVSTISNVEIKGKADAGAVIPVDTEAPTIPANLAGEALSDSSIKLTWDVSTDNEGVKSYNVYRDDMKIAATELSNYIDTNLTRGQAYAYSVSAVDDADNESGKSIVVTVTTKDVMSEVIAEWTSFNSDEGNSNIHLSTGGQYHNAALLKTVGGQVFEAVTNSQSENSVQYQGWDNGEGSKYWLVTVPTNGFENITVSSKQRSSGSGPADFKLQYSTNGNNWTDVQDAALKLANGSYAPAAQLAEHLLAAETSDQNMLYLRFVVTSTVPTNLSNPAVGASGSSYMSQLQIKGERINGSELNMPLVGVASTPAHEAVNVDKQTETAVKFSMPVVLTSNVVHVVDGNHAVISGATAAIDAQDAKRLIVTMPELTYGQSYTITIPKTNLEGLDGSALHENFVWTFTMVESPLTPKLLSMSFYNDPKTNMAFAWYTDTMTDTVVQVIEADKVINGIFPSTGAKVYQGTEEVVNTFMVAADRQSNNRTPFVSHKVIADALTPGTTYKFRLGNGEAGSWSKIGSFTTDTTDDQEYRFIVGADTQASTLSAFEAWGDTFRKAIDYIGDPKFLIVAGDLVDNGDLESHWQWMLQVAEDSLLKVPFVPVLGGHEVNDYDGDVTTDNNNFYHHFNVPKQEVEGTHEGSVYSFEYGDALYMVFNSQFEGGLASNGKDIAWEDPEFRAQLNWMRNTVAKSDKKWKFVTFHKSPYASGDNSALYEDERVQFYRQHLIPVFDELGIDMVFEAHDHMYMRSFQMYGNEVIPESDLAFENGNAVNPKGTIYLMPNALGNKFYSKQEYLHEFDDNWNPVPKLDQSGNPILYDHFFANINEQPNKKMFTDVSISSQVLSFKSFTAAIEDEGKAGTEGNGLLEYDRYGIKRTDQKPSSAEQVKVALDDTTAKLTWSAPAQSEEPIRGYRVYEKNDKVAVHWSEYIPAQQGKSEYTLDVPNLNPLKKYDFVVKAVGVRMNSNPVEVTTFEGDMELEPPSAPTDLLATALSQFQIRLSWKAPAGSINVSGYHIYRNGMKIANLAAGMTSFVDTGLNPDTAYSYYITAYSAEDIESMNTDSVTISTHQQPIGDGPNKPYPNRTAYAEGSIKPNHVTQDELDATVLRLFQEWKQKYLKANPYDDSQKYIWYSDASWHEEETDESTGITYMPITVSEAHGYGMMILAIMASKEADTRADYDDMFRYFKAHPSEINANLMAWQQGDTGSEIIDINGADSATDGDMDIAYSLLLAHSQWGSSGDINYLAEAKTLINAIMDAEVNQSDWTLRIADWATSGKWASATRPSDWMMQHLKDYQLATGDARWGKVVDHTYSAMGSLFQSFSPQAGLLPDFVIRDGASFTPALAWFLESEVDGDYNYNSARTPWRIGTDYLITGETRALDQLATMNNWIRSKTDNTPSNIKGGYKLDGTEHLADWEDLTFSAPFMVSAMIDKTNQEWLNKLWDYNADHKTEDEVYFSNNVRLLSMIVVSGNWWSPTIIDSEAPTAPVIDSANAISSTVINLKWLASSDNLGVAGYKVFRDGVEIATVTNNEFKDTGLQPNRQYAYMVIAFDAADNQSAASNMRLVTTLNRATYPEAPAESDNDNDSGNGGGTKDPDKQTMTPSFKDISSHWAEKTIERAVQKGLFNGYTDGTFKPDNQMTREQFAVVISRLLKLQLPEDAVMQEFADESKISGWARQAVAQSAHAGFIQGYTDGTFRPNSLITRAEMAVIIGRILHSKKSSNSSDLVGGDGGALAFTDGQDIPTWAQSEVDLITELGIMIGKSNNRFAPSDHATRAEAAVVFLKLSEILQ